MPYMLSSRLRNKVVRLWLRGYTLEQCAEKTGVSFSSCRVIIDELKKGRYPEYESFRDELEDLRSLNQQLRTNNMSLAQAAMGMNMLNSLLEMEMDPPKLAEALALVRRIAPPDFPIKTFVKAGLRIIELEEKTGIPFQDLHAQYQHEDAELKELGKRRESIEQGVETANEELQETLKENSTTLNALREYARDRDALQSAGLSLEDLKTTADFVRRAKVEGALDAAIELFKLELQTGRNYSTLLKEYKDAKDLTDKLKLEAKENAEEIKKSKRAITQLRQEEKEQLANNQLTKERLASYATIREKLGSVGINLEDLEGLGRVLEEIENQGWEAGPIVKYIQEIDSLKTERNQAQASLLATQKRVGEEKGALKVVLNRVGTARSELEHLQDTKNQRMNDLACLREQAAKETFRIELFDSLFALLMDPSGATDSQLRDLIASLEAIVKTRNETGRLPIDYGEVKERAVIVFENVLGRKWILKETADNMLRLLSDRNMELLFDRAGRIANERIELQREKADLVLKKKNLALEEMEFEESSNEKLLSTVLSHLGKGLVYSKTCEDCGTTFAYQLGKGDFTKHPFLCPFCLVGSLREHRKLKTYMINKPV